MGRLHAQNFRFFFPVLGMMVLCFVGFAQSQFFDPILPDKTYLDNIQKDVEVEVEETKTELVDQAKVVENVTRAYIAAKLKENVFRVSSKCYIDK